LEQNARVIPDTGTRHAQERKTGTALGCQPSVFGSRDG
jgi:hypothetical protein